MNENSVRRRAWVKNAIIVFLAIMLILTFFSNTIMNYSLPEVAAQYAQSGSITSKIRTTATVKANSTHDIKIEESRTIKAVAVREGDKVQIGDVLVYLEDAESTQLKQAREQLATLEKQYKLKMLVSGTDYYSQELAIKQKTDDLNKAKKQLAELTANLSAVEALEAEIKELNAQTKTLNKQITAFNKQITQLKSQAADVSLDGESTESRIAAATILRDETKTAYEAAEALKLEKEAALEAAEEAYQKAAAAYEAIAPDGSADAASIQEQIAALQKTMRRAKEDYDLKIKALDDTLETLYDEWVDADFAYYNALANYNNGNGDYDTVERWYQKSETARLAYEAKLSATNETKADLKLSYDRQTEDNTEKLEKLEKQLKSIAGSEKAKTALDTATKNKKTATTESTEATADYTEAKKEYETAAADLKALEKLQQLESCELSVENLEAQVEEIADQVSDKNAKIKELTGGVTDEETQREKVQTLTEELETLQHNLDKKKEEDNLQAQRNQIEIDELLADIEEQKALVAKYEANSTDAKIIATVAGQVASLTAVAGKDTTIGQTLCQIVVTDMGYICEISLTTEQAKRVRVGDEVSVTNSWWSNIKASVVNLRNDPDNPGNSKIATIEVSGDVSVGQTLNLTIGERGQSYDAVVPNSAIREDNNGKFVLVVEAKSSPLGNRYIARRYDVTVLASDDTNSAVSGLLGSEFIITTSTKPISSGSQVRLVENSK
ncbi:MAG: HlyD family efflux transporter periplasmic adaptor subunit [Clostridia bacterium]|nr:HlyD family efflux transporter periplasmic adaptor subunit [Clostridia bacterium]